MYRQVSYILIYINIVNKGGILIMEFDDERFDDARQKDTRKKNVVLGDGREFSQKFIFDKLVKTRA